MENDIFNNKKSGRKKTIFIGISVFLIMLLGVLLNLNIHAGTNTNPYQRALVLGYGDYGLTITIGPDTALGASPDYACDGTADDVQFQQALNALPANGGKLHVLGGQYNFTSTVTRAIGNVIIEGNGYSTYFVYNGANPIFTAGGSNWVFEDIRFDAGFVTANTDTQVLRCWDGATYYAYDTNSGADNVNLPTGRTATYVVAASNSSDAAKAQADYVCDGTDDNVQIQAAIDALNVSYGGVIQLTDGLFTLSAPVQLIGRVTIRGMGQLSTQIGFAAGSNDNMFEGNGVAQADIVFEHFLIDGGKAVNVTSTGIDASGFRDFTIRDVHIQNCKQDGIYANGAALSTTNWRLERLHIGACDESAIELVSMSGLWMNKCYLLASTLSNLVITSCNDIWIVNNTMDQSAEHNAAFTSCGLVWIQGNYFGANTDAAANGLLMQTLSNNVTLIGNQFYQNVGNGCYLAGTFNDLTMIGNVAYDNGQWGFRFPGMVATNAVISNNNAHLNGVGDWSTTELGTGAKYRQNLGLMTVNSGSWTNANGLYQPIAHGLDVIPLPRQVQVFAYDSQGDVSVSAGTPPTATNIYVKGDVGKDFIWRVDTED